MSFLTKLFRPPSTGRSLVPAFLKGKTRKQRRRRTQVMTALAVGLLFLLIAVFVQPFTSIEWWLSDQLFLPTTPSPNIVIVTIDNETLDRYGKWSEWSRSLHAQAIDNLAEAKAMVIGMDVVFTDESVNDPEFARALADAGNVVLAGAGVDPIASPLPEIVYSDFLVPTPVLSQAAAAIGHANLLPDGDGTARRIPLVVADSEGVEYPSLTLSMLYNFFGSSPPDDYTAVDGSLHTLDREIPVDGKMRMRVNFVDQPGSFTRLSYADVIEGNFDPEVVKYKIVLVGMTATGEPDAWVTPVSAEKMFGVEIHANALDTILRKRFLVESSTPVGALVLALMVGITGTVLPLVRLRWGALLIFLLAVGYLLAVFFAFDSGYILNILYPLLLLPIMYATTIVHRVVAEQAERRHVKDLFGRYVSAPVAREILGLSDADELKLGGTRQEVTVFFADMRGFTAMSEKLDPESIVAVLNKYLSVMIECVLANDGMINKFAGDNIMAVWNAPQEQPEHALLAVKAALECQQAIGKVSRGDDSAEVQFGIGVNTGDAVAGNMGSEGRSEYTVIGDAVNLASRLCSKAPGGEVWIGPETADLVKDAIEVEETEPQYFKGKAEAVRVFRALRMRSH